MAQAANDGRKRELLDRIVEVLRGYPVDEVTFRMLAGELGVSTYTLVYNFGSRQELVEELDRFLVSRLAERASEEAGFPLATIDWLALGDETIDHLLRAHRAVYRTASIEPGTHDWRLMLDLGARNMAERERGESADELRLWPASRTADLIRAIAFVHRSVGATEYQAAWRAHLVVAAHVGHQRVRLATGSSKEFDTSMEHVLTDYEAWLRSLRRP